MKDANPVGLTRIIQRRFLSDQFGFTFLSAPRTDDLHSLSSNRGTATPVMNPDLTVRKCQAGFDERDLASESPRNWSFCLLIALMHCIKSAKLRILL